MNISFFKLLSDVDVSFSIKRNTERQLSMQRRKLLGAVRQLVAATEVAQALSQSQKNTPGRPISNYSIYNSITVTV